MNIESAVRMKMSLIKAEIIREMNLYTVGSTPCDFMAFFASFEINLESQMPIMTTTTAIIIVGSFSRNLLKISHSFHRVLKLRTASSGLTNCPLSSSRGLVVDGAASIPNSSNFNRNIYHASYVLTFFVFYHIKMKV